MLDNLFFLQYSRSPSQNGLVQILDGLERNYSWRTSSSCFRDVGSGNLFLTVVSWTHQSGAVMLRSGDCAGQGGCWSLPSCSRIHDCTVSSCMNGGIIILGWLRRFSEIRCGSWDAPDYCPRTPLWSITWSLHAVAQHASTVLLRKAGARTRQALSRPARPWGNSSQYRLSYPGSFQNFWPRPTPPNPQCIQRVVLLLGMKRTAEWSWLLLLARSRMRGGVPPLPSTWTWRGAYLRCKGKAVPMLN
jgi:hypothetical protein